MLRTYARYLGPLTVLSLVAFAPLLATALRAPVPRDAAQARMLLVHATALAAWAIVPLLVLVGAARVALDGGPRRQVLVHGAIALARAIAPAVAILAAVVLGSLALVVPGIVLLVLLAPAAASPRPGIATQLADTANAVRARPWPVVITLAAAIAAVVAILAIGRTGLSLPLPRQPAPDQLAAFRTYVRATLCVIAVLAPLPALALARAVTAARA